MTNAIPFRALRSKRTPVPIQMKHEGSVGEIFIYDDIGAGFFEDGVTANRFASDLKAMGDLETLNIFINSPGGSVFEGVAINNIIKRQQARKIVHIDGIAASIASVVAMAGDEIRIANNGMMMIHNPWTVSVGEASELRQAADNLDKIGESITATYVARTTTEKDVITSMMDAETWMTAQEAVDLGFADSITEAVDVAAMAKFDLSVFQNTPQILQAEKPATVELPTAEELRTATAAATARIAKMRAEQQAY